MLAVSVGCQKQPYPCVPVSGKVIYEDGSLISAERISVTFLSQTPSTDPRVHPRAGTAVVDCKTGSFASATTFVAKDGIIPGEHKVLIQCYVGRHMATDLVGDEYASSRTTPLTINTSQLPLVLKVRKPKSR